MFPVLCPGRSCRCYIDTGSVLALLILIIVARGDLFHECRNFEGDVTQPRPINCGRESLPIARAEIRMNVADIFNHGDLPLVSFLSDYTGTRKRSTSAAAAALDIEFAPR
jgi:hypothetical protein